MLRGIELTAILRGSELFGALSGPALAALLDHLESVSVPGGQLVIHEGDIGDSLYLVISGRLRVYTEHEDATLNEIGPGGVVGELALLSDRPRTVSVRAIRDTELLKLPGADFRRILHTAPDLLLPLSSLLVDRLAGRSERRAGPTPVRTIAVVAADPHRTDLASFCADLVAALERLGPTLHVNAAAVDSSLGRDASQRPPGHSRHGQLVTWLQAHELADGFTVFEADRGVTEWTKRCLRQADRVLVVGDGARRPRLGHLTPVLPRDIPSELVLVHPAESPHPRGTAAWLDAHAFFRHHHVRAGDPLDHSRVARIAAGRAIAVVLGGGGPRGFTHLGVLRAIEEGGIPIDAIGGTSIGAVMAGSCAMGWDDTTRVRKAVMAFVETRRLVPPTLPLVAFSSSRRLTHLLAHRDYFGEVAIEDLWIPYFCISANLTRDEMVVHDRGPVWRAVRASISMPGILPPVYSDGDLLVDGGVINDLPVDVMRRRITGSVIAVDLKPEVDLRVIEPFDPSISGWQVLLRRLNPFRSAFDLPNPLALAMRAKEVAGRRAQRDASRLVTPDLVLHPPASGYDSLDFSKGRELIELGYRYALDALAASPVAAGLKR